MLFAQNVCEKIAQVRYFCVKKCVICRTKCVIRIVQVCYSGKFCSTSVVYVGKGVLYCAEGMLFCTESVLFCVGEGVIRVGIL